MQTHCWISSCEAKLGILEVWQATLDELKYHCEKQGQELWFHMPQNMTQFSDRDISY